MRERGLDGGKRGRSRSVAPVAAGILVADSGRLRLTVDRTFNSPSTAAGVILGRSANGRQAWKYSAGQTLSEIQAAAAGMPGGA